MRRDLLVDLDERRLERLVHLQRDAAPEHDPRGDAEQLASIVATEPTRNFIGVEPMKFEASTGVSTGEPTRAAGATST